MATTASVIMLAFKAEEADFEKIMAVINPYIRLRLKYCFVRCLCFGWANLLFFDIFFVGVIRCQIAKGADVGIILANLRAIYGIIKPSKKPKIL